jgi:hypothetical protein
MCQIKLSIFCSITFIYVEVMTEDLIFQISLENLIRVLTVSEITYFQTLDDLSPPMLKCGLTMLLVFPEEFNLQRSTHGPRIYRPYSPCTLHSQTLKSFNETHEFNVLWKSFIRRMSRSITGRKLLWLLTKHWRVYPLGILLYIHAAFQNGDSCLCQRL